MIGKSKEEAFIKNEQDYLKRLKNIQFELIEIKALSSKEKNDEQAINKINTLSNKSTTKVILLDESGPQYNSNEFSSWIYSNLEVSNNMIFVIGGSEGHGKKIKEYCDHMISLSKMTLPHRVARLVMIEQIYRAETIQNNHPYHK